MRSDRGIAGARTLSAALEAPRDAVDPARPFLRWKTGCAPLHSLTYGEALDGIDRTRALFAQWGLGAGDRVLLATRDDRSLALLVLACLGHGAVAVVCNPEATPREAQEFVSAATPAAAVVDEGLTTRWPLASVPRRLGIASSTGASRSLLDRLLTRASGTKGARPAASYPAVLAEHEPAPPSAEIPDDDEAYVLFTSGSTGHAKGVRIRRRSLLRHARTLITVFGYDGESRVMIPLPTYHTDGFLSLVVPFLCGATTVRPAPVTATAAPDVLDALRREQVTHLIAVPMLLRLLLDAAESRSEIALGPPLRAVISTGSVLDERLWQRFEERFALRLSNFYGLTETVTGGLFCGPSDETYRRGTVGRPVDCEVAIAAADGADTPTGGEGELRLRGDNVMIGYLADGPATAAVLQDGWLRTGDLAARDEDGFVRIVGRTKTTVIFAGHNIQPEEVTRVLETCPGVAEAAAFGVPHDTFGEVLVAAVVLAPGSALRPSQLVTWCRESLAPYKVPREIDFVERLPRGASGKVAVAEARTRYRARRSSASPGAVGDGAVGPVAAEEVWTIVRETAAQAFRVSREDLRPESSPDHTPGWDSFAHLELVIALEARFRFRLPTADVLQIRSLEDARRMIVERLPG